MIHASRVLVIISSVRPRRIAPDVARWVAEVGRDAMPGVSPLFELVDLKDFPLPMDDEPEIPAAGRPYANAHTRAWSAKIESGDAVVFVTPQYNWGYPAPLKNALDHLYKEWDGKPAMIVSYGARGGNHCAAQLRQILHALEMKPAETAAMLKLPRAHIEANPGAIDPGTVFAEHVGELRQAFGELAAALAPKAQ